MLTKPREVGVDSSVSERARRASGEGDESTPKLPDPEVPSRPRRRLFTAAYKRRILEETDRLREPGQIGAYLRREGLYSSTLCRWRAQRDRGGVDALAPRRRGPKPSLRSPERARIAELKRQNEDLRTRLRQAETIIDVQKKLPRCWTQTRCRRGTGPAHERRAGTRRRGRHPESL